MKKYNIINKNSEPHMFLSWYLFIICLNMYIAEHNINNEERNHIFINNNAKRHFEYIIYVKICKRKYTNICDPDFFFNLICSNRLFIYDRFKRLVKFDKDIISTNNMNVSLIIRNYCKFFESYISDDIYNKFNVSHFLSMYPNLTDISLNIESESNTNMLQYPEICFNYFIKKYLNSIINYN